jgi:hypothetical protein
MTKKWELKASVSKVLEQNIEELKNAQSLSKARKWNRVRMERL